MPNSTKKGKRGERELARALRDEGYGAMRSEQVDGHYTPDLLTSLHEIVHFEVKRTGDTKLTHESKIKKWLDTAEQDCPDQKIWVIAWRPDHGSWHFLIDPTYVRFQSADGYYVESPFVMVWGLRGLVSTVDPRSEFTVQAPDKWAPTRE